MEGTLIDGRYTLLAPLGAGGQARVFRAKDESSGADVAIRLPKNPTARIVPAPAPTIPHDRWVQLLASGIDPTHGTYQVFELLSGKTLGQILSTSFLAMDLWQSFVVNSLSSVEALHISGGVHGDLNADNFVLTATGWKLLELPFHRFAPEPGRSAMFGSIYTIAPEQYEGKQPTAQSDIYALGCLYYFAAARRYPHEGANGREVAISCMLHPPPPLASEAPNLPEIPCDIVMQLISKRPEDRPPDIATARQLLGVAVA